MHTDVQLMRTPSGKKNLMNIYNEVYGNEHDERFENVVLAREILLMFVKKNLEKFYPKKG